VTWYSPACSAHLALAKLAEVVAFEVEGVEMGDDELQGCSLARIYAYS